MISADSRLNTELTIHYVSDHLKPHQIHRKAIGKGKNCHSYKNTVQQWNNHWYHFHSKLSTRYIATIFWQASHRYQTLNPLCSAAPCCVSSSICRRLTLSIQLPSVELLWGYRPFSHHFLRCSWPLCADMTLSINEKCTTYCNASMPPEEDGAKTIGNMHKKFSEHWTCLPRDMLTDRDTLTKEQTRSSTYSAPYWGQSKQTYCYCYEMPYKLWLAYVCM